MRPPAARAGAGRAPPTAHASCAASIFSRGSWARGSAVYIPSYDDLTPSIPDITPGETFAHVRRILPQDYGPVVAGVGSPAGAASAQLFACLRSSRTPDALVPIARDFSPRLERHGSASVVLDVGGLGRLLGDPQTIGTELQRAAAACSSQIRVAIAETQT